MNSTAKDILARLIQFQTITDGPNLDLIVWVQEYLTEFGFTVTRIPSSCGTKAGLLARFGTGDGGVLFSAHSDVVPVTGQNWTHDPFSLAERDGRLFGRGTTDMKGFLACVLAEAVKLRTNAPSQPVMISLSWDEEIGCRGIAEMIGHVIPTLGRPDLVIVGEPTEMRLCVGHKGKTAYQAICRGSPGHSASAPKFVNALHVAADFIQDMRRVQARLQTSGARHAGYEVPYSTIHAGRMSGGVALNMVPERAVIDFEIRHLGDDLPDTLLAELSSTFPEGIEIKRVSAYPGLNADLASPQITAFADLLDDPAPVYVSYGTEAGFFRTLDIPTVVCGPGSMSNGHQPDESIASEQLDRCGALIERVLWS